MGFLLDHHMRREVRALRILFSFLQNWDIKDAQGKLYYHELSQQLSFNLNDLGASFGRFVLFAPFKKVKKRREKGLVCSIRANEIIKGSRRNNWNFDDQWKNHLHVNSYLNQDPDAFRFLTFDDAEWLVKRISRITKEQFKDAAIGAELDRMSPGSEAEFAHRMACRRDSFAKAFDVTLPNNVDAEQNCGTPTEWTTANCSDGT
jgi:hypothetical protein